MVTTTTVDGRTLADAIRSTAAAAGRPGPLDAITVRIDPGSITLCASDARAWAKYTINSSLDGTGPTAAVVVSATALKAAIPAGIRGGDYTVTIDNGALTVFGKTIDDESGRLIRVDERLWNRWQQGDGHAELDPERITVLAAMRTPRQGRNRAPLNIDTGTPLRAYAYGDTATLQVLLTTAR